MELEEVKINPLSVKYETREDDLIEYIEEFIE